MSVTGVLLCVSGPIERMPFVAIRLVLLCVCVLKHHCFLFWNGIPFCWLLHSTCLVWYLPRNLQALATTRVQIMANSGGPQDSASMHSRLGASRERKFTGSGSDTDIIVSSARAYTSAINKLLTWNIRRREQMDGDEEEEEANGGVGDAEPAGSMSVVQV